LSFAFSYLLFAFFDPVCLTILQRGKSLAIFSDDLPISIMTNYLFRLSSLGENAASRCDYQAAPCVIMVWVLSTAIDAGNVRLVFDCPRAQKRYPMFISNRWPIKAEKRRGYYKTRNNIEKPDTGPTARE
jgi:hypothetical protein